MTDPISATGTSAALAPAPTTAATNANSLGKDTFLKLLVAQLRYQDPSKPTDATQFLSQTAQFTLVEKLDDLRSANADLLAATRAQSATALVGRTVSWTDDAGAHTGVVSAVGFGAGTPVLTVAGSTLTLDQVTAVTSGTSTSTPAGTPAA
jgi:flagellar basal-body rod modification protein FlgD